MNSERSEDQNHHEQIEGLPEASDEYQGVDQSYVSNTHHSPKVDLDDAHRHHNDI